MKEEHPDLSALREVLPPFVPRTFPRIKELTGYCGRTWANMDAAKETSGIKRITFGRTVAYERESLIRWLEQRCRVIA